MAEEDEDLSAQIEARSAERERLDAEIAAARQALEERKTQREASTREHLQRMRRRRILTACVGANVILVALVAWWLTRASVTRETLRGEVSAVTGPAPSRVGERCTLQIVPQTIPSNAWLQIDCGRRRLFGYDSSGYATCEELQGRAVRCSDHGPVRQDGDPHVVLDRPAGTLVVDDGERWKIEIRLEPTR